MRELLLFYLVFSFSVFAEENVGNKKVTEAMNDFADSQKKISRQRAVLADEIDILKSEVTDLKGQLSEKEREVIKELETGENIAEKSATIEKDLAEAKRVLELSGFDNPESLDKLFSQLSVEVSELVSPAKTQLTVFDKSGLSLSGESRQVGSVTFWLGESDRAGVVYFENDTALLKEFFGEDAVAIKRLFAGEIVELPVFFDKKTAFSEEPGGLINHLRKGGAAMIPLLLLATLCLVVAVVRAIALFGIVHSSDEQKISEIARKISNGEKELALKLAGELKRPLSEVIREGVENAHLSKDSLEEILYERVTLEVPQLERWLAALAVGATAAPLLGLLGTVTGMISTFKQITVYGTGNAAVLSDGISEALITTETGLIIAVPALIMHAWLARRVSKAVSLTQKGAIVFVNELKVRD